MNHLLTVVAMIEAAGIAVSGVDLYIGTIPADCDKGVMLRDPLVGVSIDRGMNGFYSHEFQVIVRDPDVEAGYARALAIAAVVEGANIDMPLVFISWIEPCTKPAVYPRGDADNLEISFPVRIGYADKA